MKGLIKTDLFRYSDTHSMKDICNTSTNIRNESECNGQTSIGLLDCKTVEDVTEVLSQIAATSNQSLAYALKAQMQVIKYISSKELIGSTFDLLFCYIKKSLEYADEEYSIIIKERTGLLLNNFINFMDAKLRWEINTNRKEIEDDLLNTSNDLANNILTTIGYTYDRELSPTEIINLRKIIFDPNKANDGWFRNFKRHLFKKKYIREKRVEFLKSLDLLALKLETKHEILGSNDIIAGIFQNHREELIEFHSSEWMEYEYKAKKCRHKSWGMAITTLLLGLLCGLVATIVFFKFGLPKLFYNINYIVIGSNWLTSLWAWIGIGFGITSIIVAISYRIGGRTYLKKGVKKYEKRVRYYDNIIELYREKDILTLLITLLRNSCNIMMFTSFAMIEIINSPTPSNHPRCIIPTSV